MANTLLTPTIISKRALIQLDNNLVMGNMVYRDYEAEFGPSKIGDTISIRRPVQFSVTDGATLNLSDVQEGKLTLQINSQKHVGFTFPSTDLTLTIDDFDNRYIKPAMIQLANAVDTALMGLYKDVWNWVGTPGQLINSYQDWSLAPQRLDNGAVPSDNRMGILTPNDWYAMTGSLSGLFNPAMVAAAVKDGAVPDLGGISIYKTQNILTHTFGTFAGTPLINGASQVSTYASVKDTMTQNLITDGWSSGATSLKRGDSFTIAGVYAVNPVTKSTQDYLQQFVVTADISDTTGNITMVVSPALILTGPYQTVSAAPADNAAITMLGATGGLYRQNMAFHKNAFALAMVPFQEAPSGSGVAQSTERYKGLAATFTRGYDITNFREVYRFDVLFGVKAIDPRLASRVSGTA